jgi:RND family efflux transporter MFP subunit
VAVLAALAAVLFVLTSGRHWLTEPIKAAEQLPDSQAPACQCEACLAAAQARTEDDAGGQDHAHAGDAHAHGDEKTSQITVWGERFEVFLEHPFLVAGRPAEFVTDVSDLTTGEPRTAGPVIFVLSKDAEMRRELVASAPARAGIYIPELTFPQAGQWAVTLRVPAGNSEHEVALPPVTVYASQAEADAAPEPESTSGLSFLKEQQWPLRMKVQAATRRTFGDREALAIPKSAIFEEAGRQTVFVQVAGETLQKRFPELGEVNADWAEVSCGVGAGEQVVCTAVQAVAKAIESDCQDGCTHAQDDPGHTHADPGHIHGEAELGEDRLKRFDIETETVSSGALELRTTLAGEVKLNADKVAHVVPQVPGKVRQVLKNVGDTVATGEVVAWLESATLGQAKIDYLSKYTEISCCTIELTRAQEVHDNATRLLEVLASSPSLASLRDMEWGPMGRVRSDLVSAYAELQYARAAHAREKQLFDGNISSADDFRKAESALDKAEALYQATRDSAAFDVQHALVEATRTQQLRELEALGAERTLYVLGLTATDVHALQELAGTSTGNTAQVCTDPNCAACAAARANPGQDRDADRARDNERLAWYPLRAPFAGTVIQKHLSLGESVKDGAEVFVIADLATVWVDFRVHQRDLSAVESGREIVVECGQHRAKGTVAYLAPVLDDNTRTTLARVVLPNSTGCFRPGTFVSGTVYQNRAGAGVIVRKSAIQYVDDQPCVFVYNGHAFEQRNVTIGHTDDTDAEIVAGLSPGEDVVMKNAFRIKAEIEKDQTAAGGHGHVH